MSCRGSVCVCLLVPQSTLLSPNFLKLTKYFPGTEEENGVVLGIHLVTLPTRAHWPVGWMPATSPSFLSEKNLSARLPPGES